MRIVTDKIGLYSPEQTYQNQSPKIKTDQKPQENDTAIKMTDSYKGQVADREDKNLKIFSNQELATLKALFGYELDNNNSLYGNNKLHNVQSGILLDVKG